MYELRKRHKNSRNGSILSSVYLAEVKAVAFAVISSGYRSQALLYTHSDQRYIRRYGIHDPTQTDGQKQSLNPASAYARRVISYAKGSDAHDEAEVGNSSLVPRLYPRASSTTNPAKFLASSPGFPLVLRHANF